MTEHEAWQEILRCWCAARDQQNDFVTVGNDRDVEGICEGISALYRDHMIDSNTEDSMLDQLQLHRPHPDKAGWWWSTGTDGHDIRIGILNKLVEASKLKEPINESETVL